jgi:sugar lactone lactonase YvrE
MLRQKKARGPLNMHRYNSAAYDKYAPLQKKIWTPIANGEKMPIIIRTPLEIVADGCLFTEDPRWYRDRLYFSDTIAGRVCAVDAAQHLEVIAQLDDHCSGLGFMPNGDLLIVSAGRRQLLRLGPVGLQQHADLSALALQGINDMVVDRDGRAYVGELRFDAAQPLQPQAGNLFLVQADGGIEIADDAMVMSNGSVITDDGRTLIVAETLACRITAFDIGAAGRLNNRRIFAQLPDGYFPDGIALDAEGGIWAACPFEHGVIRVEQGGRITHSLPIENGRAAYACALGGPERRTLFVCTSATHEHERARELRSSRIEKVAVEFSGVGLP